MRASESVKSPRIAIIRRPVLKIYELHVLSRLVQLRQVLNALSKIPENHREMRSGVRKMLSTVDEPTRTSSGTNARNSANTFTDNLIYRMPATSEVTGLVVPVIGGVERISKASFRQATILSEVGFTSEKLLPGSAEMRNHFFLKQDALNFNASYGTPVREVSQPCLRANNLALSTTLSHKNLTKITR